jgi:hypothetical protein
MKGIDDQPEAITEYKTETTRAQTEDGQGTGETTTTTTR